MATSRQKRGGPGPCGPPCSYAPGVDSNIDTFPETDICIIPTAISTGISVNVTTVESIQMSDNCDCGSDSIALGKIPFELFPPGWLLSVSAVA